MNKKIASLFASVGFDIDTTDLNKLDGHLKSIRGNTANLSRNLRVTNTQLNTTTTRMRNLAKSAEAVTKFNNLGGKYVTLSVKVKEAETAVARFGRVLKLIEPRLDSTNFRLSQVTHSWMGLAAAVRGANSELSRVPNKTPRPVSGSYGGYSGSGGSRSQGAAGAGFLGGLVAAAGRFTPTGMVGGTAATTAAVGVNEIRKAGQEQQRMENMLLFSTNAKGAAEAQAEYARNLEFVRKESLRLGLDTAELGKAFAQVNMSAGDKLSEEARKKMFTDMSEYIMVTGAGQEDQKLIFKAVNQMFSLGRIMAEEMNQLTERGVPRQQLYDLAKTKYGVKDTEAVLKLQEKGKLKPEDLLPLLFEGFAKRARDTGAFAKMQESSIYKQNVFKVQLKQMSKDIMDAGLDKAIGNFFEVLTASLPQITTFLKSLGWVANGIGIVVKAIWNAVTAWGAWIGENPRMTATLSTLLLIFAGLTAKITGSTVALGGLWAVMKAMGKKSLFLITMLAIWYLFKEYDKYLKGEDTWMTAFQRKIAEMTIDVRLFRQELGLMWEQLKDGELANALGNPSAKSVGKKIFDEIIPPWLQKRERRNFVQEAIDAQKAKNGKGLEDVTSMTLPHKGVGNGQPMLAAEVMLPVVLQDKMGNVIDRQNIPTKISLLNTGGLMLSPFSA